MELDVMKDNGNDTPIQTDENSAITIIIATANTALLKNDFILNLMNHPILIKSQ